MKKGLYAILAVLAVFALVLTGCPDGGGGNDPEGNDVRELASIKLGDGDPVVSSGTARAETLDAIKGITSPRIIKLSADGEYEVTLNFRGTAEKPFNGEAKIAKVTKADELAETSFQIYNPGAKPKLALVDEDLIYVKMTAENKKRHLLLCLPG